MTALGSELWSIGLGGLIVGLVLGIAVAYYFLPSRRGEKEFEKIRKESEGYQKEVHDHFVRTSELFQELNADYRSLYEHLAKGAHTLVKTEIGSPDLEMLRLNLPPEPQSAEHTVDILSESGADTPSEGVWTETTGDSGAKDAQKDKETEKDS